jgi:hypothetical protein
MPMRTTRVRPAPSMASDSKSLFVLTKARNPPEFSRFVKRRRVGCDKQFPIRVMAQNSWMRDILWNVARKPTGFTSVPGSALPTAGIFHRFIVMGRLPISSLVATALVGVVASTISFYAVADEFDTRFEHIAVGLTRGAVTAILGDPDAEVSSTTLGLRHSWARWSRGGRTYKVQFVDKYVIGTKTCTTAIADC